MSKNIVTDFDLATKIYDTDADFVPYPETDPGKIAFIQAQPTGYKILHDQQIGLEVASKVIDIVSNEEDVTFAAETLAFTGLTTAWYLFGRGARVQRRRLKLEKLATDDPEQRPSALMLHDMVRDDYKEVLSQGKNLLKAYRSTEKKEFATVPGRKAALGRLLGHASLTLACLPIGDDIGYDKLYMTDAELQLRARDRGKEALELGRTIAKTIGRTPAMAHLAHHDSELAVYWRRNAPAGAKAALMDAMAA